VLLYMLLRWLMVQAAALTDHGDCLRLSFIEATRELDVIRRSLLSADAKTSRSTCFRCCWSGSPSTMFPGDPDATIQGSRNTKVKNKGAGRYSSQADQ